MSLAARHRQRDAGFALAETLVSLAIIATITAATFDTMIGDARIERQMRDRREAVLVAQSELARAVADAGAASGSDAGWRWRVSRARYAAAPGLSVDRVAVAVGHAGERPLIALQTLALRP